MVVFFQVCDDPLHAFGMMAAPVNLTAIGALLEVVNELAGARFEHVQNFRFFHILEQSIAGHTACERLNAVSQVKAADNLFQLFGRVG